MDFNKYDKKDLEKFSGYTIDIKHVPLAAFPWRWQGENLLDSMKDIAERFGYITVKDYCELADIPQDICEMAIYKTFMGSYWLPEELNRARIRKKTGRPSFYLYLPNPRPEPDLFDGLLNSIQDELIDKYIKEDKTMTKINYNNYNTGAPRNYSFEDAPPEDVEFEKKRKELMDEAEKKILDIRHELAIALDKLEAEWFEQEMQRKEEAQAKAWKRKYDALIEAGFSEDQAWQMTMESFKID